MLLFSSQSRHLSLQYILQESAVLCLSLGLLALALLRHQGPHSISYEGSAPSVS